MYRIIVLDSFDDWIPVLSELQAQGIKKIGVLGGGELIGSFAEQGLLDELSLTVCPIVLGGATAPTWCGGQGFLESSGLKLELLEAETINSEIFVHYRVVH